MAAVWGSLATIGNVLSFTDTTVANGATFHYSVAAISAYGEGPRSVAAVAQRACAPTAPTSPAVAPATGRTGITVSWNAPTSNGGSPVTGYRIYRGAAAGGGRSSSRRGRDDDVPRHRGDEEGQVLLPCHSAEQRRREPALGRGQRDRALTT